MLKTNNIIILMVAMVIIVAITMPITNELLENPVNSSNTLEKIIPKTSIDIMEPVIPVISLVLVVMLILTSFSFWNDSDDKDDDLEDYEEPETTLSDFMERKKEKIKIDKVKEIDYDYSKGLSDKDLKM